ncbi:unnamed protein product [Closterium sp. Naga37s-1]|nr:unnamed protein product [Closterium sp. Naga37s-1]
MTIFDPSCPAAAIPAPGSPPSGCSRWKYLVFGDCVCSARDAASLYLGLFSIACWAVAEVPQVIANCQASRSGVELEEVPLALVLTWIVGTTLVLVLQHVLAACSRKRPPHFPAPSPTSQSSPHSVSQLYTSTTSLHKHHARAGAAARALSMQQEEAAAARNALSPSSHPTKPSTTPSTPSSPRIVTVTALHKHNTRASAAARALSVQQEEAAAAAGEESSLHKHNARASAAARALSMQQEGAAAAAGEERQETRSP